MRVWHRGSWCTLSELLLCALSCRHKFAMQFWFRRTLNSLHGDRRLTLKQTHTEAARRVWLMKLILMNIKLNLAQFLSCTSVVSVSSGYTGWWPLCWMVQTQNIFVIVDKAIGLHRAGWLPGGPVGTDAGARSARGWAESLNSCLLCI